MVRCEELHLGVGFEGSSDLLEARPSGVLLYGSTGATVVYCTVSYCPASPFPCGLRKDSIALYRPLYHLIYESNNSNLRRLRNAGTNSLE